MGGQGAVVDPPGRQEGNGGRQTRIAQEPQGRVLEISPEGRRNEFSGQHLGGVVVLDQPASDENLAAWKRERTGQSAWNDRI